MIRREIPEKRAITRRRQRSGTGDGPEFERNGTSARDQQKAGRGARTWSGGRAGRPLFYRDVTKPKDFKRSGRVVEGMGRPRHPCQQRRSGCGRVFRKYPWTAAMESTQPERSIIFGCRGLSPSSRSRDSDTLVNVASNAGIACLPRDGQLQRDQGGAIPASETLRCELAPHNIGVTVVCPTFFKTNLMDQFTSPDERQKKMAEKFFEKAQTSSEKVARHIISSIEKNRFYVITQRTGDSWWSKRHFGAIFQIFITCTGKGMDKYLGDTN